MTASTTTRHDGDAVGFLFAQQEKVSSQSQTKLLLQWLMHPLVQRLFILLSLLHSTIAPLHGTAPGLVVVEEGDNERGRPSLLLREPTYRCFHVSMHKSFSRLAVHVL